MQFFWYKSKRSFLLSVLLLNSPGMLPLGNTPTSHSHSPGYFSLNL